MLLWDLPVGLVSDGLGDPVMHLHHIGAFIVAGISFGLFSNGVPIGSSYAPVFIGVIELSSIPLAIVDGTLVLSHAMNFLIGGRGIGERFIPLLGPPPK